MVWCLGVASWPVLLQLLALKFKLAEITLSSEETQLTLSASLPTLPTGSSVQQAMNRVSIMCAKILMSAPQGLTIVERTKYASIYEVPSHVSVFLGIRSEVNSVWI